jgi:hypothetical protein
MGGCFAVDEESADLCPEVAEPNGRTFRLFSRFILINTRYHGVVDKLNAGRGQPKIQGK